VLWILLLACRPDPEPGSTLWPGEERPGGEGTVFEVSERSFSLSARNLEGDRRQAFFTGNSLFNQNWVEAGASTTGRDGLGPLYNARSCSTCHFHDGRGQVAEQSPLVSALVRLSVVDDLGEAVAEPVYGGQLQPVGLPGVPGEGEAWVDWDEVSGAYDDGSPYTLRRPSLRIEEPGYGPLSEDLRTSVRVAPQMIGLGLLEAIDGAEIEGDGARVNRSPDGRVGRFGWKAGQPTVLDQCAGAFAGDMGITSDLHPQDDCTEGQGDCVERPSGGDPEIDATMLDRVAYYSRLLAVPARRAVDDPAVLRGKALFLEAGCHDCHRPGFVTADLEGFPELSGQQIYPFTDLRLHDMGPDLDDGHGEGVASGELWRTPPLWGLGLVPVVNDHDQLLHDGRARGFAEAILWHGGEAEASALAFRALSGDERDDLVRFLEDL
jgi:CxxC motif-containing protein (DUF1111 family)